MAFLFLALVGFSTAQPLMSNLGLFLHSPAATVAGCCGKRLDCQPQDTPSNHHRRCAGDECNPFMSCAYGNFFLVTQGRVDLPGLMLLKEKKTLVNDNRLAAGFSDRWHPPDIALLHTS